MTKVASIVGRPGMCSDDGRALTYEWRIFTNQCGGRGFWEEERVTGMWNVPEQKARDWCVSNGYEIQSVAWQ